jgi:hypothetical protein
MKSSWQETKQRSCYHFDNTRLDPEQDRVIPLGFIEPCWQAELDNIVAESQAATWRTRGAAGKSRPESELAAVNTLNNFSLGLHFSLQII